MRFDWCILLFIVDVKLWLSTFVVVRGNQHSVLMGCEQLSLETTRLVSSRYFL